MKEIRYNDRIWFGKYKNKRVSEIIKIDQKFVMGLAKENKIFLEERIMEHFYPKKEFKYSTHLRNRISLENPQHGFYQPRIDLRDEEQVVEELRSTTRDFYQPQEIDEQLIEELRNTTRDFYQSQEVDEQVRIEGVQQTDQVIEPM